MALALAEARFIKVEGLICIIRAAFDKPRARDSCHTVAAVTEWISELPILSLDRRGRLETLAE